MNLHFLSVLDIPTLTFAIAIVYLGSVLFAVLLYAFKKTFPGAKLWLLGQAIMAAGVFGLAFQALGLPYETLVFSNTAMLASAVIMGHAIWKFRFSRRFPFWAYLVIPLGMFAWYAVGSADISTRVYIFSGSLGALTALDAVLFLLPTKPEYRAPFLASAIYYITISCTAFARVLVIAFGHPIQTIAGNRTLNRYEYLIGLLIAFFNLFGYFLLSSSKVEHDLKAGKEEVKLRNDELVETLATKDVLITVLGHDLRAPVWSAARYVRGHLVEYSGDLNDKRESIETLALGLDRISGLLDSLLEWAMCASGRVELKSEPVIVSRIIADASADIASSANIKKMTIDAAGGDDVIQADPRALATVFRNLLSNAVKYSKPESRVVVRAERAVDAAGVSRLVVSVEDTGVGMKPEQIAKLFTPGRTILTLGTDGEQGVGFGLAISKLFVEAMGGSMQVTSELGIGTKFMLDFPIAASQ